jgi:hypothetical protein
VNSSTRLTAHRPYELLASGNSRDFERVSERMLLFLNDRLVQVTGLISVYQRRLAFINADSTGQQICATAQSTRGRQKDFDYDFRAVARPGVERQITAYCLDPLANPNESEVAIF